MWCASVSGHFELAFQLNILSIFIFMKCEFCTKDKALLSVF